MKLSRTIYQKAFEPEKRLNNPEGSDPHLFHADPVPGFEINADPDPDPGLDFSRN